MFIFGWVALSVWLVTACFSFVTLLADFVACGLWIGVVLVWWFSVGLGWWLLWLLLCWFIYGWCLLCLIKGG